MGTWVGKFDHVARKGTTMSKMATMSRMVRAGIGALGTALVVAYLHLQAVPLPPPQGPLPGPQTLRPRPAHTQQPSGSAQPAVLPQRAVLDQYCVSCHNERLKTAGLMLDQMDIGRVGEHAEVWEKVVRKLRAGAMP